MSTDALIERFRWETRGFCLTYEWMCLVRELKARPWRWKRILQKWWVEMKREELSQKILAGLERKMLTVTGTAEFTNEGRLLETKLVIQPHFPHEHELLEKIVKVYASELVSMEQGQLVMRRTLLTALPPAASAPETGLESSTQSGSASDSQTKAKSSGKKAKGAKPASAEQSQATDEDAMANESGNDGAESKPN